MTATLLLLELTPMQAKVEFVKPTEAKVSVNADNNELNQAKQTALKKLSSELKVAGFRPGKVPEAVAEKYLDPNTLAQETVEIAVNDLYFRAMVEQQLRPVDNPQISVKAFVPYEQLEFEATVEVVGEVKLGKYSGLKIEKQPVKVIAKDVDEVIDRLRGQLAEYSEVKRAAKNGDQVVIDFEGSYADTHELIDGGSGTDYPLIIGSNTFIPGFEEQLIGAMAKEEKTIKVTFPKDYQAAALRGKKAEFKVNVKQVNAVKLPPVDDKFAAKTGPFKSLDELKKDIRKELTTTRNDELAAKYQNELVGKIVDASEVALPESLLADEVGRIERDQRQNAVYRGMTWKEYLQAEGFDEVSFAKLATEQAEQRIKSGLVLGEVANRENLTVSKEELNERLAGLRQQYANDQSMLSELNKEQNQQDIKNRILVEKTVKRLEELKDRKSVV